MDAIGPDDQTLQAAVRPRAKIRGAGVPLVTAIAAIAMVPGCGRLCFDDVPTYAEIVLADRPLGYWRLDETTGNAMDASGHGFTGVYSSGVTRGVSGALVNDPDAAVQLDGVVGAIAVDNKVFDPSGTTAFTLEAWIKPTAVDVSSHYVVSKQVWPGPEQGVGILVRTSDGLIFERYVDKVREFASFPIAFDSACTGSPSARQIGSQLGRRLAKIARRRADHEPAVTDRRSDADRQRRARGWRSVPVSL